MIEIVFETHSLTEDNERYISTGWNQGALSEHGRELALEMGVRRKADGLDAIFTSDLWRSIQTASIAFADSDLETLHDWRLRECDYGKLNGAPREAVHRDRQSHLDQPYPNGESWRQAVARIARFLDDLPLRWQGKRIMVIGHVATGWGLEHLLGGTPLEELLSADFAWQEGWEYRLR